MANKIISYIYHDPNNTAVGWIGYTEVFDDAVISVADKIAEQYQLRAAGLGKAERYFFEASLNIFDDGGAAVDLNGLFDIANDGGTIPSGMDANLTDFLNFVTTPTGGFLVGDSTAPIGTFQVNAQNGNGTVLRARSTSNSEYIARMQDVNGLEHNRFRASGRVDLAAQGNTPVTIGGGSGSFSQFHQFSPTNSNSNLSIHTIESATKVCLDIKANGKLIAAFIPVYLNVASAQADGSLQIGAMYRTTSGGANPDSQVRIKI